MDKQKAQFLVENKDLLKRICSQLIADVEPDELFLVNDYIDVFIDNIETIDVERVPSGESSDTPLAFGGPADMILAVLVPVVTSTLSKFSEYLTVDKLKEKAADKKKSKEQIATQTTSYEFQYHKKGMTIKFSSNKLTRKKADELSQKILELIAQEL